MAKSGKSAVQGALQGGVQTAVAKSGKGAVQGVAHAFIQTAVKSGKGAVQGAVQRAVLCFPRWEPSVPTFRNWKFFAMVTYGSQVGKQPNANIPLPVH